MGVDDTTRLRRHLVSGLVAIFTLIGAVSRRREPIQGLLVVGLAFYGTWLIYQPAAYLVAAFLLLLESVT